MFGKSEHGTATIVARNIWDYIADVVPDDGGKPFRATFTEIFEGFQGRRPEVGEQAPVTFDKREVKFDRSALHEEWKAAEQAKKSGFAAPAEAPPGTAPTSGAGDFSATMAAIAAARAAGDLDEVNRLKAAFAAARAQE